MAISSAWKEHGFSNLKNKRKSVLAEAGQYSTGQKKLQSSPLLGAHNLEEENKMISVLKKNQADGGDGDTL